MNEQWRSQPDNSVMLSVNISVLTDRETIDFQRNNNDDFKFA